MIATHFGHTVHVRIVKYVLIAALCSCPVVLAAHGVSSRDALFVRSVTGPAVAPFMYLGAKHMVTGYDHLLFLVGVVFFLRRLRDVVVCVSLFTLGHSTTLLLGVLGDIRVNSYLIDVVIALSVVYMAFGNAGGFDRLFGYRPNTRIVVLLFGLFHGFGLASKLQELRLPPNGLLANLLSFNVGIEIGQISALAAVLLGLSYWRTREGFHRHAFATNAAVMTGGFVLLGYQLTGYVVYR